jgi:hypothetical protein
MPSHAHIVAWHCHLCGRQFSLEHGGCCRSCGRVTCDHCWGDRRAFVLWQPIQRQCKECVVEEQDDRDRIAQWPED